MQKISKKQRMALREIDTLSKERRRNQILGWASIGVMVLLIVGYNTLTYNLGVLSESNTIVRAMMYITAMVIAGFSGIMLMKASQKQRKIDGFRQSAGISRETLEAWKKGEIEP
ncbi:MAG: hypothetical protein IJI68_04135 [Eggerthellaceae bacterium]|nr:hypothetical protein [Eggerthellaceae bacterium]